VQLGKVVNSHRAYLGVTIADGQGGGGALVYSVDPNGPAAKAGMPGDVLIVEVDGQATPDQPTLTAVIAQLQPGQTVAVKSERRNGTTETKQVTLGELPG
jgi:putative serine protease PepD